MCFDATEMNQLFNMKHVVKDRLILVETSFKDAKIEVEATMRDLHWVEGAYKNSSCVSQIQGDIKSWSLEAEREPFLKLMEMFKMTSQEDMAKLEDKVEHVKV